jgi:hypothetical protein
MTVTIGRRELLAALGGAATWLLAARAQQRPAGQPSRESVQLRQIRFERTTIGRGWPAFGQLAVTN